MSGHFVWLWHQNLNGHRDRSVHMNWSRNVFFNDVWLWHMYWYFYVFLVHDWNVFDDFNGVRSWHINRNMDMFLDWHGHVFFVNNGHWDTLDQSVCLDNVGVAAEQQTMTAIAGA